LIIFRKEKKINGEYYANLLQRLGEEIKKKRPHLAKKKVLFHQDSAPYSPDLAPSDYFLFPNLKKWLGSERFANNEEVQSAVDGYCAEIDYSHYKQGIEASEHRREKCIELKETM
jgi:histone-lysine N-methyltransferase SETMAR